VSASIASRFRQGVAVGLALGVAVYLGFALWAGARETAHALASFSWRWAPTLLALSLLNYALRFLRWQSYLRTLGLRVPIRSSALVFLAGLAMTITPGKVGEFLKSWLLWERHGIPMARSAPIVFAERVTDLLALVLVASFGVASYGGAGAVPVLVAAVAATVGGLLVLQSRGLTDLAFSLLTAVPGASRLLPRLGEAVDASRDLLSGGALLRGLLLSTLAWLAECWEYHLGWRAFGVDTVALPVSFFGYAFSTVAGVISPGGLGPTDVGLIEIARRFTPGLGQDVATAAAFVVRVATLWFAVGIGAWALLRFGRAVEVDVESARAGRAGPDASIP
jgi:uncharacterized membrane protein YbhN (UPF0104 family)